MASSLSWSSTERQVSLVFSAKALKAKKPLVGGSSWQCLRTMQAMTNSNPSLQKEIDALVLW